MMGEQDGNSFLTEALAESSAHNQAALQLKYIQYPLY